MTTPPDIIVVGAGAAGAVLAARLSETPGLTVLLLEAGNRPRGPLFSVPLMTGVLLRSTIANWSYETEPQPHLNNRRLAWPRGKALGGSTAINGMVYMRGLPSDYDGWGQLGLPGWSFEDVRPAFERCERTLGITRARAANPLFAAYLEAGRQAGHRASQGFNGDAPAGIGTYDFTIRDGRRVSTATAYLDPARGRPNLAIRTGARVLRVLIEQGRATGVVLERAGSEEIVRARHGVVLSAGAVGSPHLLMLSGVGPAMHLRAHGLPVQADLPGVGGNLQDHVLVRVVHRATEPVTIDGIRRVDRAAMALLEAWWRGTGPAASFPIETGGLLCSEPELDTPDLQTAFMPGLSSYTLHLPFIGMRKMAIEGHGFFANVFQMRPESRGTVSLAARDPLAAPRIQPNYLSAAKDRAVLRAGVRRLREIFAQAAFDRWRGPELAPGADATSDADLDRFIAAAADTVYHPAGTCAMGPDRDPLAVLDARLRVRGVDGLRVADASAMPRLTSSNTAAPSMMIAERCADLLREDLT